MIAMNNKMKIGIIGWYGYSNFGDERILHCLKRYFSEHDVTVYQAWEPARKRINEINQNDIVIIGGGGLIVQGVEKYIDIIEKINKPLFFLGISIETKSKK